MPQLVRRRSIVEWLTRTASPLIALFGVVLLGTGCTGGEPPRSDRVAACGASCGSGSGGSGSGSGWCGDGACSLGETCATCPSDCGTCLPTCGDGACSLGETCATCPIDCGTCLPTCGDGACNLGETCSTCPIDCGICLPTCGDGACNLGETCATCPSDCGTCLPTCGDGACSLGETCATCPFDCGTCPPTCGDGVCSLESGETCATCPFDCGTCPPTCGDGVCSPESGETCATCPFDCGACGPTCGDGVCSAGETCDSCPYDCGTCPTPCQGSDPEDCYNVLQVFEETAPGNRPAPSCTEVATWITADTFDPWALNTGTYRFESANLPSSSIGPFEIRNALFDGSLVSFNLVSDEGQTLCSFVSTWDAPLKSQWMVESPPLTPETDTPAGDDVCDNGWAGAMGQCQAEEEALLEAAQPGVPPQDTSDVSLDPDYIIYVDP